MLQTLYNDERPLSTKAAHIEKSEMNIKEDGESAARAEYGGESSKIAQESILGLQQE